MSDWTGNRKSVFSTIGAIGHSKEERQNEDFYATDPIAIDKLEKSGIFDIPKKVWECSCGQGHLSERLKEYGHEVFSTDIVDRNYGEKIVDFLSFEADNFFDEIGGVDCIITNPPYKYTIDFVLQALRLLKSGYACFFLKTTALESRARYEKIFRNYPPPYMCCNLSTGFFARRTAILSIQKSFSEVERKPTHGLCLKKVLREERL